MTASFYKQLPLSLLVILQAISLCCAAATNDEVDYLMQQEFNPRLQEIDNPLLTAGNEISTANVDQYNQWLGEPLTTVIREGDLTITLGQALIFPTHPNYLEATKKYVGQTSIGEQPGELLNYQTGRPFLTLKMDDPQAGVKAAWNMRYAYAPDEIETEKFIWHYRDMARGHLERTIEMYASMLRYNHRHTMAPHPQLKSNPANLYSALYLRVRSPQDIRNTQLLIHRNENDAIPEQAWMYMSSQRRVRRLATGQQTDAFLSSDIMIEDFLGYNGRIMDMDWAFIGSDVALLPMYAHNQLNPNNTETDVKDYQVINFSGKGMCFPNVTWQLRKVYHLEASPKDINHPLSKRHYIIDAATFSPALTYIYDSANKLWKLGLAAVSHSDFHTPENKGWQGAIIDGVSMIDLQAQHCTTLQFKSRMAKSPLKNKSFTTQHLRSMGR